MSSDSESFKTIYALLKLFMSKQAYKMVSVRKRNDDEAEINKNNNFVIIMVYVDRLRDYCEKIFKGTIRDFRNSKLEKYINMMRILTNCLTSGSIAR